MPSTYTVNLGIEKPATGEQSGTWGDTTNVNFDIIDQAVNGSERVTLTSAGTSGSPNDLNIVNGSTTSSEGRNKWIEIYSASDLGGSAYVRLVPNDAEKILFIRNSLAGSQSVLLFQGTYNASNDLEIPAGVDMVVKFDGAGASATVTDVFTKLRATEITTPTLTAGTADINGGSVDGATVGAASASTGAFTTLTASTSLNIASSTTVDGVLDEDNMASDSATKLATQQSIKAYVDSQVGTVDTLAEILANGNTSGANNLIINSGQALTTNTINETTAGTGVTIDSVLLKDDGVNATNLEITNIKANDGTAAATIANSTGNFTITNFISNSVDIGGGAIDGTVIGAASASPGTFTTFTSTGIDDNATSTKFTVADSGISVTGDIFITDTSPAITFTDTSFTDLEHKINSSSDNLRLTVDANNVDTGGRLEFLIGPSANQIRFGKTESSFNETSMDVDFRVESDSNTHMLFVDAGNNQVIIGDGTAVGSALFLQRFSSATGYTTTNDTRYATGKQVIFNESNTTTSFAGITLLTGATSGGTVELNAIRHGTALRSDFAIKTRNADGNSSEKLRLTGHDGHLGIGVDDPLAPLSINKTPDTSYGVANFAVPSGNPTWVTLNRDGSQDGGFKIQRSTTADMRLFVNSDEATVLNYNGGNTGDSFQIIQGAGSGALVATFDSGNNIIFNDNSGDQDFRVESDSDTNMLFVDGSANRIGIKNGGPISPLHINAGVSAATFIDTAYAGGSGGNTAFSDAGTVNNLLNLRTGYSSNPEVAGNDGMLWGLKMTGYNGSSTTLSSKTAAVYARSEDTGGGYNRTVGLEIQTSAFDQNAATATRITGAKTLLHYGAATFNEDGADYDFRVETDNRTNALFVDASGDAVNFDAIVSHDSDSGNQRFYITRTGAINQAGSFYTDDNTFVFDSIQDEASGANFLFRGSNASISNMSYLELAYSSGAIFNEGANNFDFRVESQSNANVFFVDASANAVGIRKQPDSAGNYALDIDGIIRHGQGTIVTGIVYPYVTSLTRTVGTAAQWIKIWENTSSPSPQTIFLRITASGDNTSWSGDFVVNVAGYNFQHSIELLDYQYYNQPKITEIKTVNPGSGVTNEIWVSLASITSSVGTLTVQSSDANLVSSFSAGSEPSDTLGTAVITDSSWQASSLRMTKVVSNGVEFADASFARFRRSDGSRSSCINHDDDGMTIATLNAGDNLDINVTGGNIDFNTADNYELTINEGSADTDFRVESNGNTHMLFVNGGGDTVSIGTSSSPSDTGVATPKLYVTNALQVSGGYYTTLANPNGRVFTLNTAGNGASAFIKLEGADHVGYRSEYMRCTNASGIWTITVFNSVTSGTAPTFTIANNSTANPTITLGFNGAYSGGYCMVNFGSPAYFTIS